jgi:hypothetical protein
MRYDWQDEVERGVGEAVRREHKRILELLEAEVPPPLADGDYWDGHQAGYQQHCEDMVFRKRLLAVIKKLRSAP